MSPMTVPISRMTFTVADYYKMAETGIIKPDDRVELLNGEIITMSPINSSHAYYVDTMTDLLYDKLDRSKYKIRVQNPISLEDDNEPQPDIVVAKKTSDNYLSKHPNANEVPLVIEVADSSLNLDRTIKAPLFAEAGIVEYWIINIPDKQIEVFRKLKDGQYEEQLIFKNDNLSCQSIDFDINIGEVF